jgi:hypothetical protein
VGFSHRRYEGRIVTRGEDERGIVVSFGHGKDELISKMNIENGGIDFLPFDQSQGQFDGRPICMETACPEFANHVPEQDFKIGRLLVRREPLGTKRDIQPRQERIAIFDNVGSLGLRLHGDGANDGKQVFHAVAGFGEDELLLRIVALFLRHIVEDDEVGAALIGTSKASYIDKEGALADRREICLTSYATTAAAFGITASMRSESSGISH